MGRSKRWTERQMTLISRNQLKTCFWNGNFSLQSNSQGNKVILISSTYLQNCDQNLRIKITSRYIWIHQLIYRCSGYTYKTHWIVSPAYLCWKYFCFMKFDDEQYVLAWLATCEKELKGTIHKILNCKSV